MKTIDAKSMLIGFLLCAVGVLTMGASELDKGIINRDGVLYVKGLVVTGDVYNPSEGGNVYIGANGINMKNGEYKSQLLATSLTLFKKDKETIDLVTTNAGVGEIRAFNKFGNLTALLGITKGDDGGIFLYDRYGDFGRSLTGKN